MICEADGEHLILCQLPAYKAASFDDGIWKLIGSAEDKEGKTDVSANKHKYLGVAAMPATNMIQLERLTKSYGKLTAVRSLSLAVQAGEIFGFLGPNGAGKTTTIRMLAGLLRPTAGSASVAGYDVVSHPLEAKRRTGYLAENPYLYEKLSGREFLDFMADLYSVGPAKGERIRQLLALFGLEEKADELAESYSRGMRQKLGLAGALIHEPRVLLLDEPTSGLDPPSARLVKDLLAGLARKGCTVFLSTHILEIAEHMCHRVGIINRGELIAVGTLDELRRQARADGSSLEDLFLQLTGASEHHELLTYLREG